MIVLDLVCNAGHKFEGWFLSVESFDAQVREDLVSCPHCNSQRIERLPAAPYLARNRETAPARDIDADVAALMDRLRATAEASEDVGERFPEEARRIHYREAQPRSIRGHATLDETRDLLEEGIPVLPIPAKPRVH